MGFIDIIVVVVVYRTGDPSEGCYKTARSVYIFANDITMMMMMMAVIPMTAGAVIVSCWKFCFPFVLTL